MSLAELHPVVPLRGIRRAGKAVQLRPRTALVAPASVTARAPIRHDARRDRRYWIEHCEGFRVEGVRGRIGVVSEVRQRAGEQPILVIRTGMLGSRVVEISASEVVEIAPHARRLWLRTPEPSGWSNVMPGPLEAARAQAAA